MTALNHVAVTVRDVDASRPWYAALFGADPALDEHTDALFRRHRGRPLRRRAQFPHPDCIALEFFAPPAG